MAPEQAPPDEYADGNNIPDNRTGSPARIRVWPR
jgi:hypothetical protein